VPGNDPDAARRRRTRLLQKYVANPPMKLGVWAGVVPGHMLVETVGRKTGKRRRTVVGCHVEGDTIWVVSEQGRHAGYVRNLEARPQVRVRIDRRWRPATAAIVDGDDSTARLASWAGRQKHADIVRKVGTSLLTLRFDLGGEPADR
jgi:deazaflavin-dependent oxidoreductase (nitroreductase family)